MRPEEDPVIITGRLKYVSMMNDIFGRENGRRVEQGCYDEAIKKMSGKMFSYNTISFYNSYSSVCYKVLINGDPNSSVNKNIPTENLLSERVRRGEIDPSMLGSMSEKDMYPEINMKIRMLVELRRDIEIEEKESTLSYCTNCKNNSTKRRKDQARCGDEGVTWFIKCLVCKKQWSENS